MKIIILQNYKKKQRMINVMVILNNVKKDFCISCKIN